jgi:hypothetical protein
MRSGNSAATVQTKQFPFFADTMIPVFLYLLTLLIVLLLTVLIETIALQLMRWGDFKGCLRAALVMNLASIVIWFIMLVMVPQLGLAGLLLAFLLSTVIEWGVLARMRRGVVAYNFLAALVANLASYLIILLPAFLYS